MSKAQDVLDRIAREAFGGVSEHSTDFGTDFERLDADLRLVAKLAGLHYETDDAYKKMCDECGWPLPLNEDDDPSDHAEWCDQYEEN